MKPKTEKQKANILRQKKLMGAYFAVSRETPKVFNPDRVIIQNGQVRSTKC
jgi:hypothetical protein